MFVSPVRSGPKGREQDGCAILGRSCRPRRGRCGSGMDRSRIRELHYITDIANVSSILDHGILSHRLVKRRIAAHVTVASVEVQAIRAVKRIWGSSAASVGE